MLHNLFLPKINVPENLQLIFCVTVSNFSDFTMYNIEKDTVTVLSAATWKGNEDGW